MDWEEVWGTDLGQWGMMGMRFPLYVMAVMGMAAHFKSRCQIACLICAQNKLEKMEAELNLLFKTCFLTF